MSERTQEAFLDFMAETVRDVRLSLYNLNKHDSAARDAASDAAAKRRATLSTARKLLGIVKIDPESFVKADKHDLNVIALYVREQEREDAEHPLERLLNWKREGEESVFVLSELFDLIGKDDARTFKILLRDVIKHYDPVRAESFL
jgi:hypothetical protein